MQVTTGRADGGCLVPPVLSSQAAAWLGNASPLQQLMKRWVTELHCLLVQHCAQQGKWWGRGINAFPRISALMTAPFSISGSYWWSLWRIKGCKGLPWSVPISATSGHSQGSAEPLTRASGLGGVLPVQKSKTKLAESNHLHTYLMQTYLNELRYTFILCS